MSENANAPGLNRGAAENSVICATKHNTESKHRPTENQAVVIARNVGALFENYATRQIAMRQIGRAI